MTHALIETRRPIGARDTNWSKQIARWLTRRGVTPNTISFNSMVFAAAGGAALYLSASLNGRLYVAALVIGILGCQLRLLCNLFDGMVAIEGEMAGKDGPFWNEFPDRISDTLLFVGAGYASGVPELGWAAAALAIFTAYIRELGRANGLESDFSGPMAKQHRMATLTLGLLIATLTPIRPVAAFAIPVALGIVVLGSGITTLRRARKQVRTLNAADKP